MPGPLSGLKVLDFTTLLPGPFATMNLADMGAEVLRIVSGSRPDLATFAPPWLPGTELSFAVAYLGRGKRCMTLNFKDPRAIRVIHQLLAEYDIVIEQFRPGVLAKFGLDYESLKKVNPGVIYCSLTGYGQTGPYTKKAGHDINYLARSGLMSYSGRKTEGPSLTGMQIADVASGSYNSIIGILAAVIHRMNTGNGQHIDISMTDGVIVFNALVAGAFLVDGTEPEREMFFLNGGSLYDFYETKDGKYLSFGGLEPQFFAAFCETIGRADLSAGGVMPPDIACVKEEVKAIMKSKTRDEWTALFDTTDACVEPVLTLSEALGDPHVKARGLIVEVKDAAGNKVRQLAHPIKYSDSPPVYTTMGAPSCTQTREILHGLGYDEGEIDVMEREGVFD